MILSYVLFLVVQEFIEVSYTNIKNKNITVERMLKFY